MILAVGPNEALKKACVHVYMRARVHARACVHAPVHLCVRACVRACIVPQEALDEGDIH